METCVRGLEMYHFILSDTDTDTKNTSFNTSALKNLSSLFSNSCTPLILYGCDMYTIIVVWPGSGLKKLLYGTLLGRSRVPISWTAHILTRSLTGACPDFFGWGGQSGALTCAGMA